MQMAILSHSNSKIGVGKGKKTKSRAQCFSVQLKKISFIYFGSKVLHLFLMHLLLF